MTPDQEATLQRLVALTADAYMPLAAMEIARDFLPLLLADLAEARAEVGRLRGITPEFPPRPPHGDLLPRYGIRWNGPEEPLAVPMDDGYWTPWHLADASSRESDRRLDQPTIDLPDKHPLRLRAEQAEVEVRRLREALDVIQAPLHIDGEEHRGAVLLARRVLTPRPAPSGVNHG